MSASTIAIRIGAPCPKCAGTGWLRYDWGHVQTEKFCPHCWGTGMRGRHRA